MATRHKVLLVEDSPAVQQIYRNTLTIDQFQVITANNGMEAIKALSTDRPDIILLDLMMPVMDGYKVLQVVKTDPKLSMIPVLVFSAKGQPEEVEKALSLGAAGYVVKATTKPKEVIERIKGILAKQEPAPGHEVAHYRIEVVEGSYDTAKLAADFKLNDLRCPACRSKVLLDLVPDFTHGTAWFSGKFVCPRCTR